MCSWACLKWFPFDFCYVHILFGYRVLLGIEPVINHIAEWVYTIPQVKCMIMCSQVIAGWNLRRIIECWAKVKRSILSFFFNHSSYCVVNAFHTAMSEKIENHFIDCFPARINPIRTSLWFIIVNRDYFKDKKSQFGRFYLMLWRHLPRKIPTKSNSKKIKRSEHIGNGIEIRTNECVERNNKHSSC